jgi:hypothetical protein
LNDVLIKKEMESIVKQIIPTFVHN